MRARTILATLSVVAVTLVFPSAAAEASGLLSMTGYTPGSGPVGTVVVISGTGFVATDLVNFGSVAAVVTKVPKAGTSLTTSVPPLATTGPLTVTDPVTGQTVGLPGTVFQVTTGVAGVPNHVWAGGSFDVAGSELTPGVAEQIMLGKVQIGVGRTDAFGDFDQQLTMPWDIVSGKRKLGVLDPQLGLLRFVIFVLGDWPTFRHDAARSGLDPYETVLAPAKVFKLNHKWQFQTSPYDQNLTSPVVADNTVFVGTGGLGAPPNSGGDLVVARDATTGAAKWSYDAGAAVLSTPAVGDGIVYGTTVGGTVFALDAGTGTPDWSYNVGGTLNYSSPTVSNGVVYVGSTAGLVVALDATTGTPVWSRSVGGAVYSSPAVADGDVFVGADDGKVYALHVGTGKVAWSYATGNRVRSSPAVVDGEVYVGSEDHYVYALDDSTGSLTWSFQTGGNVDSSPAVADGTVFVGSADSNVYAIDAATGTQDWVFAAGNAISSSPAVADGVVYAETNAIPVEGPAGNTVYALGELTGTSQWSKNYSFSGGVFPPAPSPAVSNGKLYVATDFGELEALGL